MYDTNHLAQALRAASVGHDAARFADLPDGNPVSYGALFAGAERAAAALVALGVRPGDRVAVQIPKSIAAIQLYLGTVLAGAVFLPLNTAYTPSEVGYFLTDAEPALFVCDPDRAHALAGLCPAILHSLDAGGRGSLAGLIAAHTPGFAGVARGPDDLAAMLYTSGTTGRSKGAMLSHGNLASNAATLTGFWAFTRDDVLIHALPIFHTHGLFVATNVVLMAGASTVFLPAFDADAIVAALPRATCLMGVPTFYTRLLDHPGLTPAATAGMRLFISGSAPLLAETHARWQARTGHAILERYGMTETNMNTSNPCAGPRRAGTVGLPLPGVELRLTDPATGQPVAIGQVGGIEVRGPNVFRGYWRMPEKTADDLRPDGFFITGDLGVLDPDGYLTIVGRSKDLIISGGYNIYPKEVEALIDAQASVLESAVIGLPHPDFGEAVAAVIVPRPGHSPDAGMILAALKPVLAGFKLPRAVLFLPELPRNTMGKVQKAALRQTYAETFAPTGTRPQTP